MRKIYSLILSVLALASLASCQQEPIIEELDLTRCLTPTNVTAVIRNGEYINFNWDKSKTAEAFEVELYNNEALEGEPAIKLTIPKEDIPYLAHVEADVTYWFRARAIAASKEPSKWYVHTRALETTAIKSPLDPQLVDRSANSISISWTKDDEVDHIRITPPLDGDEEYSRFAVDAAAVAAGAVEVTGLKPSTNYSLTVHFKSAERGTVKAWTLPDLTGATKVTNIDELKQALADGAAKIEVAYSETPYDIDFVTPVSSLAIYGDESPEGARPVIIGRIALDPSVEAVTSLHFENLVLDGNLNENHTHAIIVSKVGTMSEISYLNCDITAYTRGLIYDNYGLSISSFSYDNVTVSGIPGKGGDGFDFRKACNIGSVKFTNCTFNDSFRTLIRIDANPKLESLEFSNNTVNNVCHIVDGTNNNGVIHIRAKRADNGDPAIILKKNLFLNCIYDDASATNRGNLIGSNSADKLPTEVAQNFFYNCAESFYIHPVSAVEMWGVDKCIANGGAVLQNDPCINSEGGVFYVSNEAVLAVAAGAQRWLSGYVEEPEDLTLAVTTPVKTWNLSDTKTFGKEAKKDMVRDGIRFYVKEKAVAIGADGFTFNAAATVSGGVPSDGGLGILVDRPGGLVVSTLPGGDDGAFLAISLNGTVKAGLPVGTTNQKVVFPDIEDGSETMLYLYPTAPIILSGLQWTDDIDTGGSNVLDTPVLAIDKTSVSQGAEETVTVSWEAVNKAGSYDVAFNGTTQNVTATSFAIATKSLAVGDYTVSVTAKPAADDLVREASAPSEPVTFTVKEVLKKVSASAPTVWGVEYMTAGIAKFGSGTEITADIVYGNLGFVAGGGKFKFGIDDADTAPKNRLQLASTGTVGTKGNLQFIAGGPGTLVLKARSSGDDERPLVVAIGTTEVGRENTPAKTADPTDFTFTVNAAAGDLVNIYSANKGINLYAITWTPSDDGGGSQPIEDEDAITTEYNADFSNATTFPKGDFTDVKTIEKMTYTATSDHKMTFDTDAGRMKFNGASSVGEDGIPTDRSISFKVVGPGAITHKVISGSSTDANRKEILILVTTTSEGKKVTKLYEGGCPTVSSADAVTTAITAEHLEGITEAAVVYLYVDKAVNCYNIGFKPAS